MRLGAREVQPEADDGDRGYLLVYATQSAGTAREVEAEVADGRASRLYVLDAEALNGKLHGHRYYHKINLKFG